MKKCNKTVFFLYFTVHAFWSVQVLIQNILTLLVIYHSHYTVPTLTVTLTANTTRLPNVAPYNTFFLNCTATSSVESVGNVTLRKRFQWRRRYISDATGLTQLSSNATIQIQNGNNLTQPSNSSMLIVTEDLPQNYQYRCQVDLDLPADSISTLTDVDPITVTGKCSLQCVWYCLCASDV